MSRTSKIKTLNTKERFLYWIQERESIRLKKEADEEKPWTDDEILQNYKFCNVRRMDDRVSKWLLENWYFPHYDHPNMLTACTLARQLNNTDSLEEVGFPDKWNPKRTKKILEARVRAGLKNFSAAYMITGTLGGTKIEQIIDKVVTPLHQGVKSGKLVVGDKLESLAVSLHPYAGFSSFMAGQVSADARWAIAGSWFDKDHWAPAGPGSMRGLRRLQGEKVSKRMKQTEFLEGFDRVVNIVDTALPNIAERLEAIDYQNCLCEFDKYERTLWMEGRPKQRYPGVEG